MRLSGSGAPQVARTLRRLRPEVDVRLLIEPREADVVRAEMTALGVVVEDDGIDAPPAVDADAHV